jgi:hypothetical protein
LIKSSNSALLREFKSCADALSKPDSCNWRIADPKSTSCPRKVSIFRDIGSSLMSIPLASFTLIPPMSRRQGKSADEEQFGRFCRTFGLRLRTFSGEVGNIFETVTDAREP